MRDNAIPHFREALKTALDAKHPAWDKRHSWRKRGTEPELGVWADTLMAWVDGKSLPNPATFDEFLKRADFTEDTRDELRHLYDLARSTRKNQQRGSSDSASQGKQSVFVGRNAEMGELRQLLLESSSDVRVVTLHSLGGMGKTSLARAIIASPDVSSSTRSVWIDSGIERVADSTTFPSSTGIVSFDSVVRTIAIEFGLAADSEAELSRLIGKLVGASSKSPAIVVLDNLEAVEDRGYLIASLTELLGPGFRFLVTTRETFDAPFQVRYAVGPIRVEDAPAFLRGWAEILRVPSILEASDDSLVDIWRRTGGMPLAMRLVVGLLYSLPFDVVMEYLAQAQARLESGEVSPTSAFYRYLYTRAWSQLDHQSRQLLVWIAVQPAGVAADALRTLTGMSRDALYSAMKPLRQTSLVDLNGPLGDERYSCHPITRYFVMGTVKDEFDDPTK